MWASPTLGATGGVAVVGRGGRLAQRVFEQGGRIALARFDRRDGRQRGSSTRPSWKRGGKVACFYVHAPGLETCFYVRAQAGNAAARRPAVVRGDASWKRGGKAARFYVHAPKLEARRQGGLLWSHWGCVAKGSLRRCLSERHRSGGSSGPDRQRGLSTRPSWKRGGAVACFYVHAPKLVC